MKLLFLLFIAFFVLRILIVFGAIRWIRPQELSDEAKEKFDEQEDDRLT